MFSSRQQISLDSHYQQVSKEAKSNILHTAINKITSSEALVLAEEFSKKFRLRQIELQIDKLLKTHIRRVEVIEAEERESFFSDEGDLEIEFEYIQIKIPVNSSSDLNDYKKFLPSTYSISWSPSKLRISQGYVEFEIVLKGGDIHMDEERIKREFEYQKTQIVQWVNSLNDDIKRLNESLKNELIPFIESRQHDLKKGEAEVASILGSL